VRAGELNHGSSYKSRDSRTKPSDGAYTRAGSSYFAGINHSGVHFSGSEYSDTRGFTSLVYQLEALAAAASQATAQPSIANTAVNARASATQGTATSGAGNAATPTVGSSTDDKSAPQGLQLQLTFANNSGENQGRGWRSV